MTNNIRLENIPELHDLHQMICADKNDKQSSTYEFRKIERRPAAKEGSTNKTANRVKKSKHESVDRFGVLHTILVYAV